MDTKHATGMAVNESGTSSGEPASPPRVDGRSAPAKKKGVAAKPKGALAEKTKKAAQPSRPSTRATSKAGRLVCRYCGSDDLAPSFKKRRDARCRACFKKRYGSAAPSKRTTQTRKAKATK
jgi:hypothetical protein